MVSAWEAAPQAQAAALSRTRCSKAFWFCIVSIFLFGLLCRSSILMREPAEGDELVYRALVEQLEAGRGFTLQGHPILLQPDVARSQYDGPLFFHPPGGIALFWLFHRLFGAHGFAMAQLFSFSLFFWAMMLLASQVLDPFDPFGGVLVAALSAFTP